MNYIYDVLLNFFPTNTLIEFYEWQEKDSIDHVKKIPIIRIPTKMMTSLLSLKIKVSNSFLQEIKDSTSIYNHRDLKYATLFTDLNRAVALEFDNTGISIRKSSLLLDEEEEVIDESKLLTQTNVDYEVITEESKPLFLTRDEIFKRDYLLKEFQLLNEKKDYAKFNFLYEELFTDNFSYAKRYQKIINLLSKEYSSKYDDLYEIVKISNTKKQTTF